MSFTVEYSRSAADTQAFALIAEGWNELVQEGVTPDGVGVPSISEQSEVLYAVNSDDSDVIGVLTWKTTSSVFEVGIAYVEPSSRRQGVFKSLFTSLEEMAVKRGARSIRLSTAADANDAHQIMLRVVGPASTVTFERSIGG